MVHFEPRARTAWHMHPADQTLIITAVLEWVQRKRGPLEEIRPDDVVYFELNKKYLWCFFKQSDLSHCDSGRDQWQGCNLEGHVEENNLIK